MELRHLRYFLAVAEELHFGRAAARLHISQPPLSQQIRRLEKELQAPLFQRTKRHVELTNAGRVFLEKARALIAQAEQAASSAQRASRGEVGQLTVGCALWADFLNGGRIIGLFARRHPDVELELRDLTATEQKVKYEVEHPQTVLAVVEAGLGISLVPASLQMSKRSGIAYRPLWPPGPQLETVIAWRRGSDAPLVQTFVRVAREIARSPRDVASRCP